MVDERPILSRWTSDTPQETHGAFGAHEEESTWAKVAREVYVMGGGTYLGAKEAAIKTFTDVDQAKHSGLVFGTSLVLGAGIACLSRGSGLKMLIGKSALLGVGVASAIDLISDPARIATVKNTWLDTWQSGRNTERNFQTMANTTGQLAFDMVVGGVGSSAGASLARGFLPMASYKPKTMAQSGAREIATKTDTAAATADGAMTRLARAGNKLEPVNAWSRSPEPIGRDLSNFAHTPFELDGVKYASLEGFYNSLLYLDKARRAEIAQMWGLAAKKAGKGSSLQVTRYGSEDIALGSEAHHALLKRALRAKFEYNPELKRSFIETHPRPIVHRTDPRADLHAPAPPEKPGSHFPHQVFERLLTELRDEFVAAAS